MAKVKKLQKTQEELNQDRLKRDIVEMERNLRLIPQPTYFYNIGDKVLIGNLDNVIVSDILFDSKVYEITYSSTNANYGNPITTDGQKMIVKWIDIRKVTKEKYDSFVKNNDLRLSYSQNHLGSLFSKTYHFGVNFEPEYQRDYVWELEDKVSLIDSIFNHISIGNFVFIRKGYLEECLYEILDGKQRMRAILDFYEDRFSYKGKLFSELSIKDQGHFDGYSISTAEVSELTDEQVLRYFIKLNKCGRIMSSEQISKVEGMLNDKLAAVEKLRREEKK